MDPVVGLMEELRAVEQAMDAACKKNALTYRRERAEAINELLARVKALYGDILNTQPTSPLGASIILRIIAGRMPFAYARYGDHLYRVADRLANGERQHGDLVWLRAIAEALPAERDAKLGAQLGMLISRAIAGIARPVVVYRAVRPPSRLPPDWRQLAQGPG